MMTYRIHYVSSNSVMDGSLREVRVSVEDSEEVAWDTHMYKAPYEEPLVIGLRTDSNNSLRVELTAVVGRSYLINGTVLNYTWSFGDGDVKTVSTPQPYSMISHMYNESGVYNVTLIVRRVNGLAWDTIGIRSVRVKVVNASEEDERAYRILKELGEWIGDYVRSSSGAAVGSLEEISLYDRFEGLNPPLPVKFPDLLPRASITQLGSGVSSPSVSLNADDMNWLIWTYLPRLKQGEERKIWSKLGDPILVKVGKEEGSRVYNVFTETSEYTVEAISVESDVGLDSVTLPPGVDFMTQIPIAHVLLEGFVVTPSESWLEGRSRTSIPVLVSTREIESTNGRTHVSQFGPVILNYPNWTESSFDKTFYIEPFDFQSMYSMSAGLEGSVQASIGFKFLKASLAMGLSLELEMPLLDVLRRDFSSLELQQGVSMSLEGSAGEDTENELSAEAKISRGSSVPLVRFNSLDSVLTYEKVSWLYYLYTVSPVFKKKLFSWLLKAIDSSDWARKNMEFSSGAEFSALDNELEMSTSTNLYQKGSVNNEYSYSESYPLALPDISFEKEFELPSALRPRIYGVEISTQLELAGEISPSLEITVVDPPTRDYNLPVSVIYRGDEPIDRNGDGLYDGLLLNFDVTAPEGNYTLIASISKGDEVIAAEDSNFGGTSSVSVEIPGQYVVEDGPYDVGFVIEGQGTGMLWNFSAGRTSAYSANDFYHFKPEVSVEYRPFDSDGNGLYDGFNVTLGGNVMGENFTLEPLLVKSGWMIYLNNVSLNRKNWFIINGYYIRKLSGSFEVLGYIFEDGTFVGTFETGITVDPADFESEWSVITSVGPYSLDNSPAVKVGFTPVRKTNVSVTVLYSLGGREYRAKAHATGFDGDSLAVPLDRTPFTALGTVGAEVLSVTLETNGTTVDSRSIGKEFTFDFLPVARIYESYAVVNSTCGKMDVVVPYRTYEPISGLLVAVFSSGNVTRIEYVPVETLTNEYGVTTVELTLDGDLSGLKPLGTVKLLLYDGNSLVAVNSLDVDVSSLVPPVQEKIDEGNMENIGVARIMTMSYTWTAWFLKYNEAFESLLNESDSENLTLAMELHKNATELMLHAWNVESVEELKGALWFGDPRRVPRVWEVRNAYLLEKRAVEILKGMG